jgi:hypothetical protein
LTTSPYKNSLALRSVFAFNFLFRIFQKKTLPLNLNPFDRFWVINDCLCHRTQKYWSKDALIDKILVEAGVPISERSLIADIWQRSNLRPLL